MNAITENKMNPVERKEMRNQYMDISCALWECTSHDEFCSILVSILPFMQKYSDQFLAKCLIDEVAVAENRLKK